MTGPSYINQSVQNLLPEGGALVIGAGNEGQKYVDNAHMICVRQKYDKRRQEKGGPTEYPYYRSNRAEPP